MTSAHGAPATPTLPRGALVALATPVRSGRLDVPALRALVDHALHGGLVGVCPAGSTGEGMRLTAEQRLQVAAEVRGQVGEDVPVLPAIGLTSVHAAQAELAALADLGVPAALAAPPAYYPQDADELTDLYTELADGSAVPLVLYNIPPYTKTPIPVETVRRLAGHPRIVGIKDSSRDMEYLGGVLLATRGAPDFRVYTGTDTLLVPSLVMGVDGTIAASANLVPHLSAGICAAHTAGDLPRALALQEQLTAVVVACRRGAAPSGWKAALALAGIGSGECVPPGRPLAEPLREALRGDLTSLGVLGGAA